MSLSVNTLSNNFITVSWIFFLTSTTVVQIEFVIKMSLSVNTLSNNFITVSWIFFLTSTTVVQIEFVIKMSLSVNTLSNNFITVSWIFFLTSTTVVQIEVQFADDTTVVGLISNNDETHYREEVAQLAEWCGANNLSLNVEKTKEVVLDFRRRNSTDHPPLTIDSSTVERVSSTKFLGVHIMEDLTWTTNTMSLSKKAQQRLHFLRRLKRASLPPPILTTFYRGTLRVCWPAASLSGKGTAVLLIARPSSGQWTRLQRSSVPLSHPSWTFSLHDAPKNQQHHEGPHPPVPQSLPAPTIRKTVPEHQSPLRQTAQQLFPPGCESPELKSPHPPLKPHANPYLLKHGQPPPPPLLLQTPPPPNLTTPKQKNWEHFFFFLFSVQFKCATHRWVGLYKPPVVTHSPLCTRHFSHTTVCTQSHKRLSNICMFTCSCTTNHLVLFPCQLLDSQCFSLHMYSIMWSIRIVCIVCIFYLYLYRVNIYI